jgi:hypothetical protein
MKDTVYQGFGKRVYKDGYDVNKLDKLQGKELDFYN